MSFAALVGKDARLLARHRVLLVALLLYPLLLAGVLHAVFDAPPQRLSVAVLNEDAGGESIAVGNESITSATLVARAADVVTVVNVTSRDEGQRLLRDGTVDSIIVVPRGFVADLGASGRGASLVVVTDASDPVRAGIASAAVRGFTQAFAREVVEKKVADVLRSLETAVSGGTVRVLFFDVRVQGLNETLRELGEVRDGLPQGGEDRRKVEEAIDYLRFAERALGGASGVLTGAALPLTLTQESYARTEPKLAQAALPGALALSVFWTGALASAALFASEAEAGALARMRATPTTPAARAASKILVALTLVVAQGALVLLLALVAWNERPASPGLALPALALAGAAAAAAGALAAAVARGRAGAALLVVLVVLPMTLVSGLFFPIAYMPEWVQAVAKAMPLTHAVDAFRDVLVRGAPLAATMPALGALAATTAVAGAVGAAMLNERV